MAIDFRKPWIIMFPPHVDTLIFTIQGTTFGIPGASGASFTAGAGARKGQI